MAKATTSTQKNSGKRSDTPKPYIAVLVPTRGLLFTDTVMALLRELTAFHHAFFFTKDLPLPMCRNALVKQARNCGEPFTHYLMIDDDVVIPENGLQAMLDLDSPVVLIDYPTHAMGMGANTGNIAYMTWKEGDSTEGKEICWGGLGCTLVQAGVFNTLPYPYFRKGGMLFDRDKEGKIVLYGEGGGDGGEDFEFYQDLKKKGYEIKQVHGMVAGHAKVMKHVGVIEHGKYVKQHDIHVAQAIERPFK